MKPVENSERRNQARLPYVCPISVKDLRSGRSSSARIVNHSDTGILFESDALLEEDAEVYVGLRNTSIEDQLSGYAFYRAIIVWRKDLGKDSHFCYSYGAKTSLLTKPEENNFAREQRRHPRKSFKSEVRFVADHTISAGLSLNISLSGVFVKSGRKLRVGQLINLRMPSKDGKDLVSQVRVVWSNADGFGLNFTDN